MIENNIFITSKCLEDSPCAYTYTITSHFGDLLREAENRFGPRDYTYTLLGVELLTEDGPGIWYPGGGKQVIVQITKNCLSDMREAIYQLAHETVHCLCPSGGNNANYLEEGVAVHFALDIALANSYKQEPTNKYKMAYELVKPILARNPDFIKQLREIQPILSLVDKELILAIDPSVDPDSAGYLVEKF